MKKLCFALLGLFLLGCNKDDNDPDPQEVFWRITIQQDCPGGVGTVYCATEEQWNRVDGMLVVGEPCNWVTFKDIDNVTRSGYFRIASSGGDACN